MAASEAAAALLTKYTVGYGYLHSSGEERFGSGTAVKVGGRLFLATVRHTVVTDPRSIFFVNKSEIVLKRINNLAIKRVFSQYVDVAAFELESDAVARIGGDVISIDQIHDAGTGNQNVKSHLVGYPSSYITPTDPVGIRGFYALSYGCETIESSRWPKRLQSCNQVDDLRDLLMDYNLDVINCGKALPIPPGMPSPAGMSGGGVWQRSEAVKTNQLWTACDLKLVGIQSTLFDELNFLKAIQIAHWAKLLADEYPELRAELEAHFPRIVDLPSNVQ